MMPLLTGVSPVRERTGSLIRSRGWTRCNPKFASMFSFLCLVNWSAACNAHTRRHVLSAPPALCNSKGMGGCQSLWPIVAHSRLTVLRSSVSLDDEITCPASPGCPLSSSEVPLRQIVPSTGQQVPEDVARAALPFPARPWMDHSRHGGRCLASCLLVCWGAGWTLSCPALIVPLAFPFAVPFK